MEEDIKKKKGTWKVLNVDMRVSARLALAPQQQRIFGRFLLWAFIFFVLHFRFVNRKTVNDRGETDSLVVHLNYHFDFNLLDLKPQNDGPHETKNKSRISIDDIFSADTFKANLYWKENMALFKNHYSRSFWQQKLSRDQQTLVWRKAKLLLTFSILWTRILPLLGLASFSPEIISSSLSSFLPSARSTNRSSTSIRACHASSSRRNRTVN